MIPISNEFYSLLSKRLKIGERSKPTCRVEVDRMVFVPGMVEEFEWVTTDLVEEATVVDKWVDSPYSTSPDYVNTSVDSVAITFPVQGKDLKSMTSPFGMRGGRMHKGLDFVADMGTPILSAWSGKVIRLTRYEKEKDGYSVQIRHSGGIATVYMHLKDIMVSVDQIVTQGQQIGTMGNTGAVMTGGSLVTDAQRAEGKGTHLHFGIYKDVTSNNVYTSGTAIDPLPYLNGSKKMYTGSRLEGTGVSTGDTYTGYIGKTLYTEDFESSDWFVNSTKYTVGAGFSNTHRLDKGYTLSDNGGKALFEFKAGSPIDVIFELKLDWLGIKDKSVLNLGLASNFNLTGSDGDFIAIEIDGKNRATVWGFEGTRKLVEVKNILIPAGAKKIRFLVHWGGKHETNNTNPDIMYNKQMIIEYLSIKELTDTPPPESKTYEQITIKNYKANEIKHTAQLEVGNFVYMDTLTLPNVISVEIEDQFESDAREAVVTISNPNGYFSPDYLPYLHPEMRSKQSPWSFFVNGAHVSVLSDNTPIRIYLGYGLNMMRVFTGLIDKASLVGEESTMTINCRDRYKMLIEKVVTENKEYPMPVENHEVIEVSSASYRDEIIAHAKKWASEYKVDHLFLLAICQHETVMGTQGMGVPNKGGYVLGYGVPSASTANPAYKGVNLQMKYGAKRMAEALRSKDNKITTKTDVYYFHDGGDKGTKFTWSADRENWVNKVWQYYNDIKANPSAWATSYVAPSTTNTNSSKTGETTPWKDGSPWLKSAIVQDLVAHAGMLSWRATNEDLQYPNTYIEETNVISLNPATGRMMRAVPGEEGKFEEVAMDSVQTPWGWLVPFVETNRVVDAFQIKVADVINDIIADTGYRSYCDRYGTYRLEQIDLYKPIVAEFSTEDNIVSINKVIDWSRGRSHLVIKSSENEPGEHFIDKEVLIELKGEIRSATLVIPWAKSTEQKKSVADRAFFDMKRLCRTISVSIPGRPELEMLDRISINDRHTSTYSVYTIKGIRTSYSIDSGYLQVLDLTWADY